jgi:hypothetical protein
MFKKSLTINTKCQKQIIYKSLGKDTCELIKRHKGFIAGGAINSIFTNRKIQDWDIFFSTQQNALEFMEALGGVAYEGKNGYIWTKVFESDASISFKGTIEEEMENKKVNGDGGVDYGITFRGMDHKIQVVTMMYGSAEEIIDTFDFTCCMGAFDFEVEDFIFHPNFFPDTMSKTLRFNQSNNPFMTLWRTNKYRGYGYNLPFEEFLKITLHITTLKFTTMRDFFNHVKHMPACAAVESIKSRIFGLDKNGKDRKKVDDMLDEPFNIHAIIEVLGQDYITNDIILDGTLSTESKPTPQKKILDPFLV